MLAGREWWGCATELGPSHISPQASQTAASPSDASSAARWHSSLGACRGQGGLESMRVYSSAAFGGSWEWGLGDAGAWKWAACEIS